MATLVCLFSVLLPPRLLPFSGKFSYVRANWVNSSFRGFLTHVETPEETTAYLSQQFYENPQTALAHSGDAFPTVVSVM